jgi:DNA-binding LacI/PurR family transcriptional regulator
VRNKPASGRITTHQIAERANVSIGTVSNVVNNTVPVREPIKKRVLQAMEELGWRPNQLARGLRKSSSTLIGMIIPDITNPFFPSVVRGAEDIAFRHSYRVVLCNTDNSAQKELVYFHDLRAMNPAGFLIIPAIESRIESYIKDMDKPVTLIDRKPGSWSGDFVAADSEQGAHDATAHLIRMGHRNLGIVAGPLSMSIGKARVHGFLRAARKAKISVPHEFIQEANFDCESGYAAARVLLNLLPRPTGIFACNDMMAAGSMLAVRDAGLRCPEDISIVGFDNLDFTELTAPPLTTVYQPGYQIGVCAAQLLMDRIKSPRIPPKQILLPTELRMRGSVQAIQVAPSKRTNARASDNENRSSNANPRIRKTRIRNYPA